MFDLDNLRGSDLERKLNGTLPNAFDKLRRKLKQVIDDRMDAEYGPDAAAIMDRVMAMMEQDPRPAEFFKLKQLLNIVD